MNTDVTVTNVKSFAQKLDARLDVSGVGALTVDTACGGDSFVVVDPKQIGLDLSSENPRRIAETGIKITNAANQQLGFTHPEKTGGTIFHSAFLRVARIAKTDNFTLLRWLRSSLARLIVLPPGQLCRHGWRFSMHVVN